MPMPSLFQLLISKVIPRVLNQAWELVYDLVKIDIWRARVKVKDRGFIVAIWTNNRDQVQVSKFGILRKLLAEAPYAE